MRAAICKGLSYLGISLDSEKHLFGDTDISAPDSCVTVEARLTNEEAMIARPVHALTSCNDMQQKEAC